MYFAITRWLKNVFIKMIFYLFLLEPKTEDSMGNACIRFPLRRTLCDQYNTVQKKIWLCLLPAIAQKIIIVQ
ncbi:hypothetical protein DXN05_22210 [Deminuibacter soli]|uniref:Uncharacterized protein n=1 Tax=Deminuibacter soli TaxID=2291815 RepID=A0A3E1NDM0_9BACT|nr:hypothetical protein DXN05_22210 [Deminuibacter soli]